MLGQTPERALVRATPNGTMPVTDTPTVKEIPYDYVARFVLLGQRGNRVPDVINISTDGAFVAVAIGYSFVPVRLADQPRTVVINLLDEASTTASLVNIFAGKVVRTLSTDNIYSPIEPSLENALAPIFPSLLARLAGIDFKYSIIDSGTGRELQNQPIHNIAGLGKADGERPFRYLAKPQLFMPRSTIRIEVEEISEGPLYQGAELFMVFHGYKMLGYGT
jgi:hypothetical protein